MFPPRFIANKSCRERDLTVAKYERPKHDVCTRTYSLRCEEREDGWRRPLACARGSYMIYSDSRSPGLNDRRRVGYRLFATSLSCMVVTVQSQTTAFARLSLPSYGSWKPRDQATTGVVMMVARAISPQRGFQPVEMSTGDCDRRWCCATTIVHSPILPYSLRGASEMLAHAGADRPFHRH